MKEIRTTPNFITSEYFVAEFGNWHLKEGAPEDIKKEFDEYMERYRKAEAEGTYID